MRHHDHFVIGVFFHDIVRPFQHLVARNEFKAHNHIFLAFDLELIIGIIQISFLKRATVIFPFFPFVVFEYLIKFATIARIRTVTERRLQVVVAKKQGVRYNPVKHRHMFGEHLPFRRRCILCKVAHGDHHLNIFSRPIVEDPIVDHHVEIIETPFVVRKPISALTSRARHRIILRIGKNNRRPIVHRIFIHDLVPAFAHDPHAVACLRIIRKRKIFRYVQGQIQKQIRLGFRKQIPPVCGNIARRSIHRPKPYVRKPSDKFPVTEAVRVV